MNRDPERPASPPPLEQRLLEGIPADVIPFNRAALAGPELAYIQQAFFALHISGDGAFTARCRAIFRTMLGVADALLTTSCTHALEMAALLLDIEPGDEIILPSFTFVSTANAFVLRGARPVFADVRPDTLNLDEAQVEGLITDRTRAIVVVHYAGVACEMDPILAIAARHGLSVVEDNAHGLFGRYNGRALGTFGQLAALSFHETKNITCGEGGALLINDPALTSRAEIIREKGTNRTRFFRGEVDKYSWVDIGSSYLPSDILAAVLFAQLEARHEIQERRKRIWDTYYAGLRDWAIETGVALPVVPPHCEQPYHMFYLQLPSAAARDGLVAHLAKHRIQAVSHYHSLHLSEMGVALGGRAGQLPVTEAVSGRLLRLPFFAGLSPGDQERVIDAVRVAPLHSPGRKEA